MGYKGFVVYSDKYPKSALPEYTYIFDRYDEIIKIFRSSRLVDVFKEIEQVPIDVKIARLAHSENYLRRIMNPENALLEHLNAELLGVGGTIVAIENAVEHKTVSYHVGGGYHHAYKARMSGFDILNDIAIGIEYIRSNSSIRRVAVIDLDAHHANGTQDIFYSDPDMLQVSFHTWGIFPGTGWIYEMGRGKAKGTKINVPLPPGTTNKPYNSALRRILIPVIRQYEPELIIYQSGVDPHHMDSLGKLKLTLNGLYERDRIVESVSRGIPTAILAGGGYGPLSHFANANTIAAFGNADVFKEEDIKLTSTIDVAKKVDQRLAEIKKAFKPYYKFEV